MVHINMDKTKSARTAKKTCASFRLTFSRKNDSLTLFSNNTKNFYFSTLFDLRSTFYAGICDRVSSRKCIRLFYVFVFFIFLPYFVKFLPIFSQFFLFANVDPYVRKCFDDIAIFCTRNGRNKLYFVRKNGNCLFSPYTFCILVSMEVALSSEK